MLKDLPIRTKLITIMMVTTLACLALSSAANVAQDRVTVRRELTEEMTVLAEVIASRSTAALAFDDQRLALENLRALAAHASITYASLMTADGNLLAEFAVDPDASPRPLPMTGLGHEFGPDYFQIKRPVVLDGAVVGSVFIRANLHDLAGILRRQILIGLGIFVLVGALAFVMAVQMQKTISTPLVDLARTAALVAQRNDFSLRVPESGGRDELGRLVSGFNDMLAKIEESNRILQEQEIRFQQMTEASPVPLVLITGDEKIAYMNQKFVDLFGYTPKDLPDVNAWWPRAYPEEGYREQVKQQWYRRTRQAKLTGAEIDQQEVVVACKDGSRRTILFRGAPVGDQYVVLFTDLTERVAEEKQRLELAERLRQAQKMEAIGTLAGGIAHDFNNILAAIFGYAELARQDLPADAPARADLAGIVQASSRARDLVQQILAFSRNQDRVRQRVDVAEVVAEVLTLVRAAVPTTITIEQNLAAGVSPVLADSTSLHQVIMNLCTNAYQAMQAEGGVLHVAVSEVRFAEETRSFGLAIRPGAYVCLEISDTGTGLDMATAERIFEPYFTTKEVGEGTGFGLAVVQGIVSDLGGRIDLTSSLGVGTCFRIYLPVMDSRAASRLAMGEEAPRRGSERLLVVDDEAALVDVAARMLTRLGYAVTPAFGSVEAWEIFARDPEAFDLVITDQTMPRMTGLELSRRILALRPDMPIILCSGYNVEYSDSEAATLGVRALASKPLNQKSIAALVREVLDAEEIA